MRRHSAKHCILGGRTVSNCTQNRQNQDGSYHVTPHFFEMSPSSDLLAAGNTRTDPGTLKLESEELEAESPSPIQHRIPRPFPPHNLTQIASSRSAPGYR